MKIRTSFSILFLAILLSGCDAGGAQSEFREAASLPPNGFFRTDDGVNPIGGDDDPDDWRTAPVYSGKFLVTRRAYPNPAALQEVVTIEVRVTGFNVIPGGIRLVGYTETGRRVVLGYDPSATSDGAYAFTFFGGDLTDSGQSGLRRVILFDGQSQPLSYGDIYVGD